MGAPPAQLLPGPTRGRPTNLLFHPFVTSACVSGATRAPVSEDSSAPGRNRCDLLGGLLVTCRGVREIGAQPAFGFLHCNALALGVIGDLVALDSADGEVL